MPDAGRQRSDRDADGDESRKSAITRRNSRGVAVWSAWTPSAVCTATGSLGKLTWRTGPPSDSLARLTSRATASGLRSCGARGDRAAEAVHDLLVVREQAGDAELLLGLAQEVLLAGVAGERAVAVAVAHVGERAVVAERLVARAGG